MEEVSVPVNSSYAPVLKLTMLLALGMYLNVA